MQNFKAEIMICKAFNVKANTAQEALDFILHAYFKTDIVDANTESTEYVNFSCRSADGKDTGEYIAVREGNDFDIMDTKELLSKSVI